MATAGTRGRKTDTTLEKRSIVANGKATTLALEPPWWHFFEVVAEAKNVDWRVLVQTWLEMMPDHFRSRAAFLRLVVLRILMERGKPEVRQRVFAKFSMRCPR
jgi:predicted DNA-binding ribbon-helix-helix protein